MNVTRLTAVALIVCGILGLLYSGFSYAKETHKTTMGAIELSVNGEETINIPLWTSILTIVVGGALLYP